MCPECYIVDNDIKRPDVFQYVNFKQYLKDIFSYYKKLYPFFSYRYISKKVNAGSPGWFPNITSGRNTFTDTFLFKTAKLFELTTREIEYLELIVKYEQAASFEEKDFYFSKIYEIKGVTSRLVSKDKFDYYRYWYISAIRELLLIIDSDGNSEQIASLLNPQITHIQAKNALSTLKNLGLVKSNIHGKLKPTDENVCYDIKYKSIFWSANIKDKINLSLLALEKFSKKDRDFSEVVIPLSETGMEEVRVELSRLRKKILAISEKDKNRNRIYQCTLQLFPISKKI